MKNTLLFALLALVGTAAHAGCSITSIQSDSISKAFRTHGGYDIPGTSLTNERFEAICQKLRKANARVQIIGMATVLSNRSIGWAGLSLKDWDTNIGTNDYGSLQTAVMDNSSQDIADSRMVWAISEALASWTDIDKAIAALDAERKRARATMGKQSGK